MEESKHVYYLAVSADTTTGRAAYAASGSILPLPLKHASMNSTSQRKILEGALAILSKEIESLSWKLHQTPKQVEIITNNDYLRRIMDDNKLPEWQAAGWFKSDGEPVKNVDLLKDLAQHLESFTSQGNTFTVRRVSQSDQYKIKGLSSLAKSERNKL